MGVIAEVMSVSNLNHTKVLLKLAMDRVARADIFELEDAMREQDRLVERVRELQGKKKAPEGYMNL